MKKHILSILLCLCMAITLLPMAAFAAEEVGQGDDGGASSDPGAAIPVIDAHSAPALLTAESDAVPEGVTVEVFVQYGYYIYANGNPILIEGVPNNDGYCRVYIDKNRDGKVDSGDTKVSLPGVYYAESIDGYWLKGSFVFGGCRDANFTGDTSVTLLGSTVQVVVGGGHLSHVTGNTQVTLKDAIIHNDAFAGGFVGDVSGKATLSMSGGKCGRIFASQEGSVGESDISVTDRAVVGYLAGGGQLAKSYVGKTKVVGDNADLNNVFGGSVLGNTGDTSVTVKNGSDVRFLCGGGSGESGTAATCGNVAVTIGGNVNFYGLDESKAKVGGGWVYGGGEGSSTTVQSVTMDVSVSSVGTYFSWPTIYGGSKIGKVLGDVNIAATADLRGDLFCAGWTGAVEGRATVTVTGEYNEPTDNSYRLFANGGQTYKTDLVTGTTTVLFKDICSTSNAIHGRCCAACPQYFDEVKLENAKIRMCPSTSQNPFQNLTVPVGSELEIYANQLPITGNFTGGGKLISGDGGSLSVSGTVSGTTALDYMTMRGVALQDTVTVVSGANANVSNFTLNKTDYLLRQGEGTVDIVKGTAIPLTLTLDKESYQYGETATLTVTPTFPNGTVPAGITATLTARSVHSQYSQQIAGSVDDSGIATFQVPFETGNRYVLSVQYMANSLASTAEKKLNVERRPLTIQAGTLTALSRAYNGNIEVEIPAERFEGVVLEGYLEGDSGAVLPPISRYGQLATADAGKGKTLTFGATKWSLDTSTNFDLSQKYYVVPPTGLTVDIAKKQIKDLVFPMLNAPLKEGQRLAESNLSASSAECDFAWAEPNHVVRAGESKSGYAMVATVKSQHAGNMELSYYPDYDASTGAVTRQVAVTVQPLPIEKRYFAGQETRDTVDLSKMKPFGEDTASFSLVDYTKGTGLTDVALSGTSLTYIAKFPQTGDALATIMLEASAGGWTKVPVTIVLSADVLPSFDDGEPAPKPEPPKTDPSTGNTEVSVPVKPIINGDASFATVPEKAVSDAIVAAEKEAAKTGGSASVEITVDAPKGAKTVETTLPSKSLSAVAEGKTESLKISTPVANLTFDSEALKNIAGMAGKNVKISAAQVDTKALTDTQKSQVGDAPVFDFTVTSGDKTISNFNGGTATVSVPYTPKDGENPEFITVWLLDDAGKLIPIEAKYKDGKIAFVTGHFSRYAIGYLPFTDVKADWAYESIVYAYQNKLFSGVGDDKFAPTDNMNRAMLWTVLYRMAGSPDKTETTANWYADAQAWAIANGISDGTNPDGNITREQLATILFRYAKAAATAADMSDFTDTGDISGFAKDGMSWAVESKILQGNSGKLEPQGNATRAEVATMLQRFADLRK